MFTRETLLTFAREKYAVDFLRARGVLADVEFGGASGPTRIFFWRNIVRFCGNRYVGAVQASFSARCSMAASMQDVFDRLFERYGPQNWWPGESPFEILVGAVLVQNTAWRNVEKAITNLRESGVLDAKKLYALPVEELAELIRPAGYYRVKAQRLRNLLRLLVEEFEGSLEAMFSTPPDELRRTLLAVHGVGPETADAILLYVGNVPSFVADSYAHRVLARHGWIDFEADYHAIKDYFEENLPSDPRLYNEFHALLIRVGKDYCKSSEPKCEGCPLEPLLPPGGPLNREG
jgi:endonuclease-3 related protein